MPMSSFDLTPAEMVYLSVSDIKHTSPQSAQVSGHIGLGFINVTKIAKLSLKC